MGQSANPVGRPGQSGTDYDGDDIAVTPETEELRRDIEHTRSDMSSTLDAIQQRLSPETIGEQAKDTASDITAQAKEAALEVIDHALAEVRGQATEVLEQAREVVVEARATAREVLDEAKVAAREAVEDATTQAKAAVRGATIGKVETMVRSANETTNAARHGLVETVKANPLPAALTALGLGWLLINSRSTAARGQAHSTAYEAQYRQRYSAPPPYPATGSQGSIINRTQGAAQGAMSQAGDLAGQAGSAIGDKVGQAADTAGNLAGQAADTAGNVVGQVGETVGNLAGQVGETAGNLAEQAQYQALRLEDTFQRTLRENPLAVGAATLALGAAIGLALPQTARENQLMGEARDSLLERAQGLAGETVEKVQHVAAEAQQTVTETVKDEAKKQGLTQ